MSLISRLPFIFLFLSLPLKGGGSSSQAYIQKVTKIEITEDEVRIEGEGKIVTRLTSVSSDDHFNVMAAPREEFVTYTRSCQFTLIPYDSDEMIRSYGGGGDSQKLKSIHEKFWANLVEKAKGVREGDMIIISFQGDRIVIREGEVREIRGYGGLGLFRQAPWNASEE